MISRLGVWWRPVALVVVFGAVAVIAARGGSATSSLLEYRTRALAVVFVGVAVVGFLLGTRRGRIWGFELVPAATGAIAAMSLLGSLAGTPYGPGGLGGDQTFRTAAVTRFADSWRNADFTTEGLVSFYPPAYFWVLGRLANVGDIEPWRMLKFGAVATALVVPMVAYVLWRRIVPERFAALVSVVAILVENYYEPYSWLVIAAFTPWWLEVVHGVGPQSRARPALLGVVGALMIVTYWYFFVVGAVALAIKLVVDHFDGGTDRRQLLSTVRVLGVAIALSSVYWVPLAVEVARAQHAESLGNRWFSSSHPDLPMPMFDATIVGVIALVGLVYLAAGWGRDPVARGLATLLAAAYFWYLIGAAAAEVDHPLLSFRGKPLVPMILISAGVIALSRLVDTAMHRWNPRDVARVSIVIGVAFGVFAAQRIVDDVRDSPYMEAARAKGEPNESPPEPSASSLQRTIESRVGHHAVLLSDRVDVLALYPNHAFVAWDAHYAHPASEFGSRIEFLVELSRADDPSSFRTGAEDGPYGPINAFVLLSDGDDLVFRYGADVFPAGTRPTEIRFSTDLFDEFEQIPVGEHVLLVPR